MKIIDPFADGNGIWQGDSPGTIRKRFPCSSAENSVDFCSNITVYLPGEGNVFHNHPTSEELCYVISGSGIIQDMDHNTQADITQGSIILVERGELHRLLNNSKEPLTVLMVCTADTPMPEG